MWITGIFEQLLMGPNVDMPTAASNAYEPTLCQIHGFIVRNSVRLAFNMLPDRVMFLHTCRISEQDLLEKGKRFVNASNVPLCGLEASYFGDHKEESGTWF
eukprot:g13074.t1